MWKIAARTTGQLPLWKRSLTGRGHSRFAGSFVSRNALSTFTARRVGGRSARSPTTSQRRDFTVYRRIAFPPENPFPVIWVLYSLVLCLDFSADAKEILYMAANKEGRLAASGKWGVERAVQALDELIRYVLFIDSSMFSGWLSAGPVLASQDVVEKSILPSLAHDNPDVSGASADLLAALLAQSKMRERLAGDPALVDGVLAALERWIDVDCQDCGNPAPALDPLVSSLAALATAKGEKSKFVLEPRVERIVNLVNKLALRVRAGGAAARKQQFLAPGMNGKISAGSMTFTFSGAPTFDRSIPALGKHTADWYLSVGIATTNLSRSIARKFGDKTALELVPAFLNLSSALCPSDYRNLTGVDAVALCPTFEFGALIAEQFDGGSQPEKVSRSDWNQFRMISRPGGFFSSLEDKGLYNRMMRALFKVENVFDIAGNIGLAGILGFVWGGLRTTFALRHAEGPPPQMFAQQNFGGAGAGHHSPIPSIRFPSYGSPPPPGSYAATQQASMPPPSSFSAPASAPGPGPGPGTGSIAPGTGYPPQPGYGFPNGNAVPSNWRQALVVKHARLAALGAIVISMYHEVGRVVGEWLWLEDPEHQVAAGGAKTFADITVLLLVLRRAPYSFLPAWAVSLPPYEMVKFHDQYT
mmetsp:Transcript_23067/g.40831  ORF Transcript_23067/g.40831 Transcript_23067/m.40831 type:complete len:644 (-) Transcript_23067:384-2315(-)